MAVGTYNLPICDGCKLPWLPVGWTQDSDPRDTVKPLRCGKCKSIGWDREFVKQQKADATESAVNTLDPAEDVEMPRQVVANEALQSVEDEIVAAIRKISPTRCKHRMTDCPICHPKEAA